MPLDIGRVTHLIDQMHRSEDDAGDPIAAGMLLAADGARGQEWINPSSVGGTDLGWYNMVVDGGLDNTGATDNAALIEAAWSAGTSTHTISRTFYWPAGVYKVSRALQDTGAWNAQVRLPSVALTADQIVITNLGPSRPGFEYFGSGDANLGFAVIKSTLTGASGTASCIAGGNNGAASSTNWNNIATVWENLLFEAPDDPTFTMLNLRLTQGGAVRNIQISTSGGFSGSPVLPTHSNAYGIKLPEIGTSNYTESIGLSVGGFYTCVRDGELVTHEGLILGICVVCLEIPETAYPSTLVTGTWGAYNYGIRATGAASPINILSLTLAHDNSGSFVTTYDLDDPSNYLTGLIRHYTRNNTTGAIVPFLVNGGTGVQAWDLRNLGPASGVTPATYGSSTLVPVVTVDTYGRVTAATTAAIASGSTHFEILMASGSADPLVTSDGLDYLYVEVPN